MHFHATISDVLEGPNKYEMYMKIKMVVHYESASLFCLQELYYLRMQRGREKMDRRRMDNHNHVSCAIRTLFIFYK